MKKSFLVWSIILTLALLLTGCGKARSAGGETPAEPQAAAEPAQPAPAAPGRQNGERFDSVIMLEGMEETVHYEHVRNERLGFEMDYDYESFVRQSSADCERFVSVWDEPGNPENYLEVRADSGDAELVADAIKATLSKEYDLYVDSFDLNHAGKGIRIVADVIKNTNRMPEHLQTVYIIPAPDGCRIAAVHSFITESEGMLRRFGYMVKTLSTMQRSGESTLSDEQALAAIKRYCILQNPELESAVNSGEYPAYWDLSSSDAREIVVLFRSYTGAQNRYYIDRATGDAWVTEFVPGITPEEQRTAERLNVWNYVG